jgi:putative intracellular protease/amidase
MEVAGISDALARGGIHVTFASVGHENPGHIVKMMNGVMIQADKSIANCIDDQYDLIVLPGVCILVL